MHRIITTNLTKISYYRQLNKNYSTTTRCFTLGGNFFSLPASARSPAFHAMTDANQAPMRRRLRSASAAINLEDPVFTENDPLPPLPGTAAAVLPPPLDTPDPAFRRSTRVQARTPTASDPPASSSKAAMVDPADPQPRAAKRRLDVVHSDPTLPGALADGAAGPLDEPNPALEGAAGPGLAAVKPSRAVRRKKALFEAPPPEEFPPTLRMEFKDLSGRWDLKVVPLEAERAQMLRELVAELEIEIAPETLNHILYCRAEHASPQPPAALQGMPRLGYACLNMNCRNWNPPVYTNRSCVLKTFDSKGIGYAAGLALENVKDLAPLFLFNEVNGIRFMRLSSDMFPFSGLRWTKLSDLPNFEEIKSTLFKAGELARRLDHRITFHPSHFCKLASESQETLDRSLIDVEIHSEILDLMGFLPATPYNKINIHVGAAYGDKEATLVRFVENLDRLSPNARARLTLENDDKANLFSVKELYEGVYAKGGRVPIVFDFHHHQFCTGGLSERDAFLLAASTWPAGCPPVVHWSESKPDLARDPSKPRPAHSDYVFKRVDVASLGRRVDVMVEAKAKELAVLRFVQMTVEGRVQPDRHDEVLRGRRGDLAREGEGEGGAGEGEDEM